MLRIDPDENEKLIKFLIRTLTYENKQHLFSRYLLNEDDFSLPILDDQNNEVLDELRNNGIRNLGKVLSDQQVQDIHDYLSDQQVYLSHNPNYTKNPYKEPVGLEEAHKYCNFASYHMDTITESPHLSELAKSSWFVDIAKHYLNTNPFLYYMGLFWSFPNNTPNVNTQVFHRDTDDIKFLTLFVYLTDVEEEEDGGHYFIKGSHDCEQMENYFSSVAKSRFRSKYEKALLTILSMRIAKNNTSRFRMMGNSIFPDISYRDFVSAQKLHPAYSIVMKDRTEIVLGPKGTGILEDAAGFHKGGVPTSKGRLLFTARYGVSNKIFSTKVSDNWNE